MQMSEEIAAKHDLVVLFHEKPFAGINGNGKHNNWSVGTNTGINFFNPGKDEKQSTLFAIALACLTSACNQNNEMIRCSVAHAGNDWRLGAQEAPPAIVSLMPGVAMENQIKKIIAGGELHGYYNAPGAASSGSAWVQDLKTGIEDRNRTAPFPFCGNRFEFRAVGSSQNCGFPMAIINTAFADGLCRLNEKLEGGTPLRDGVAELFADNQRVIFCGNGYSAEWPIEAEKRGLPNLKDSVQAAKAFATPKNKGTFEKMGVLSPEEVDARAECMFENYVSVLECEAATLIDMVHTGVEPACAKDLATYAAAGGASFKKRQDLYDAITSTTESLEAAMGKVPDDLEKAAEYYAEKIKPMCLQVRDVCDAAEGLVEATLWPYPSYTECCFGHHFNKPKPNTV
jgi:glutamine synthetase